MPKNDPIWPEIGIFVHCWLNWRPVCGLADGCSAGCISQDTYLLYSLFQQYSVFFHLTISLFQNIPCYKVPIPTLFQSTHSCPHVCMYIHTLSNSAISILAPTSTCPIHFLRSPRSQPTSNRSCKFHGTHTHRVLPLNRVNPPSRFILKILQYICCWSYRRLLAPR